MGDLLVGEGGCQVIVLEEAEKVLLTQLDQVGRQRVRAVPMALDELVETGALKPGMRVLTVGFGGGLTWGGAVLEMA